MLMKYCLLKLWSILREIWDVVFLTIASKDFPCSFWQCIVVVGGGGGGGFISCSYFFFSQHWWNFRSKVTKKRKTRTIHLNFEYERKNFGIVMAIGFSGMMPQRCNYFSLFVKDEKTTVNWKYEHFFLLLHIKYGEKNNSSPPDEESKEKKRCIICIIYWSTWYDNFISEQHLTQEHWQRPSFLVAIRPMARFPSFES